MKYKTTITGLGPEAFEFLSKELDLKFVILFNDDVPEELAELSILHTKEKLFASPEAGDNVTPGNKIYTITAIGPDAGITLSALGHCTLVFGGGSVVYRPGCIILDGPVFTKDTVKVGDTIEIY